jgi:hypothetical protein
VKTRTILVTASLLASGGVFVLRAIEVQAQEKPSAKQSEPLGGQPPAGVKQSVPDLEE